jgi:hypothetical protein
MNNDLSVIKSRVYLSGKITGDPDYKTKFGAAEFYLKQAGYDVSSPASLNIPEGEWQYAMRRALILMLASDGVALLPDWKESKGACIEARLAADVGIPVKPLEQWLDGKGYNPILSEGENYRQGEEK